MAEVTAAERDREGEGEGGSAVDQAGKAPSGVVQAVPATAMAPAPGVSGPSRANKALIELRSKLGRHLAAVAHVLDGGRHLQEATRVMREIEKLEILDRLEAEVSIPLAT